MTRPINGWDEEDCFTGWRHYLVYLHKAGAKAAIKRRYRRRERRQAKGGIRQERRQDV